jgi:hypothetical protein
MDIYWLQPFWFGQHTYNDTTVHAHYLTIHFSGFPNIEAQVWLDLFSPGAKYSGGAVTALGSAAAGFYGYVYKDAATGLYHPMFLSYGPWESRLRVERVVYLTIRFHVRLASAKADGMIYYWTNAAAREFSPPRFREAAWCIFDKSTGEVLATEAIWTDENAEARDRTPSSAVLENYAKYPDGRVRQVDSISIERVPERAVRVDLSRRILVEEVSAPTGPDLLAPYRIGAS